VSGTIHGLDLSVLYSNTASGTVANGDPILALSQAEQNQPKKIAAEAKKPEVQRDLAAFRKAVAGAKDVKSLLPRCQRRQSGQPEARNQVPGIAGQGLEQVPALLPRG